MTFPAGSALRDPAFKESLVRRAGAEEIRAAARRLEAAAAAKN